jgi:hypothetical protein
MTLSAFAEVGKPKESANATVAAANKELNELRMALPETAPEIGVASHYREQKHPDKRISSPRTFFPPRYFSAALAIPLRSLKKRRFADRPERTRLRVRAPHSAPRADIASAKTRSARVLGRHVAANKDRAASRARAAPDPLVRCE